MKLTKQRGISALLGSPVSNVSEDYLVAEGN